MSRSTATTTTNSAITSPRPFHLIAQRGGDGGAALILSLLGGAYPDNGSIEMTLQQLSTFRLFMRYALYIAKDGAGLRFRTQPGKLVWMSHDALMTIFSFLHADIAQFLIRQCIVPVALPLRLASPKRAEPKLFFFDDKLGHLSNASLNADLEIVQRIVAKTSPEKLRILLSTKATAIITHLGIERAGTPLQMALRSGDTEMVELMASYLPPSEFKRQFKSVFGTDFAAFEIKQKEDAGKLFEGMEDAFNGASVTETTNALHHVPSTTSVLQTKLAAFKSALEKYVKTNPNHNDFILAKAYEIYEKNWSSWSSDQLCLFLQQMIGFVQASANKTSPFRLQDYAQGIYYRGEHNEPARRTYNLRDDATDIRAVVGLGSSSCINILGVEVEGHLHCVWCRDGALGKIMSSKNSKLSEIMQRAEVQLRSHSERRCCVM